MILAPDNNKSSTPTAYFCHTASQRGVYPKRKHETSFNNYNNISIENFICNHCQYCWGRHNLSHYIIISLPCISSLFTLAPASIRYFITSICPRPAAIYKAVLSFESLASKLAPLLTRIFT